MTLLLFLQLLQVVATTASPVHEINSIIRLYMLLYMLNFRICESPKPEFGKDYEYLLWHV